MIKKYQLNPNKVRKRRGEEQRSAKHWIIHFKCVKYMVFELHL